MSKNRPKNYRTFRCEVDLYRNGTVFRDKNERLYDRQTEGVYYVSAKNEKHAMLLLQKAIGFGQICIPKHQWIPDDLPEIMPGRILKSTRDPSAPYTEKIAHATDPVKKDPDPAPEHIFRFRRTGSGGYAGSCGCVTVRVTKSFGTMNWRWDLRAPMSDNRSMACRSGRIRAVDAEDAQKKSLDAAFRDLGDAPGSGRDPEEAAALAAARWMLDGCRCVTA